MYHESYQCEICREIFAWKASYSGTTFFATSVAIMLQEKQKWNAEISLHRLACIAQKLVERTALWKKA